MSLVNVEKTPKNLFRLSTGRLFIAMKDVEWMSFGNVFAQWVTRCYELKLMLTQKCKRVLAC